MDEYTKQSLQMYRGDARDLGIDLYFEGAAFDPTGYSLIWTAKSAETDLDVDAKIQKETGVGLSVISTSKIAVSLVPQDTDNLNRAVALQWDVQATNNSTGKPITVARGTLRLKVDITREATASIPIYTTVPGAVSGAGIASRSDITEYTGGGETALDAIPDASYPLGFVLRTFVDGSPRWWRKQERDGEVENAPAGIVIVDDNTDHIWIEE